MAVLVFFAHALCFWHGNKRTGLHLQSGQGIISIQAAKRLEFNEKMIRFYDSAEAAETLAFPGLWNFLRRYPAMAWDEGRRSLSKPLFAQSLQKLVPEVRAEHLAPGGSGVRAQAMSREGTLLQDFHLVQKPRALHVINAPSPAATASLAIAEEIVGRICLV